MTKMKKLFITVLFIMTSQSIMAFNLACVKEFEVFMVAETRYTSDKAKKLKAHITGRIEMIELSDYNKINDNIWRYNAVSDGTKFLVTIVTNKDQNTLIKTSVGAEEDHKDSLVEMFRCNK